MGALDLVTDDWGVGPRMDRVLGNQARPAGEADKIEGHARLEPSTNRPPSKMGNVTSTTGMCSSTVAMLAAMVKLLELEDF
ncbi:hypothetical protein CRG98_014841 [Punica granatum]|uniref:Uncharacterized protein n=1 Tax=Punica granatum TaxID=22663 RepID=A0A2I0K8A9_PUNGR|nr:hypothetical protein CRG98_014841 [Punica granatum]